MLQVPPAMSTQVIEMQQSSSSLPEDAYLDDTKTLISALSFISRNLPLPTHVFDAVSSIYTASADDDDAGSGTGTQVLDDSSPVSCCVH